MRNAGGRRPVVRTMPTGRPRLVAALLVVLALTAACTSEPESAGPDWGAEHFIRHSPTASPPVTPVTTTTPLVVALHPTRPPLDLTVAEVQSLQDGAVTSWSELDAGPGALRTGTPAEVRADRDVVAVVPAGEVAPPLNVATVDGVDPLRDPTAYAVTTEGPDAAPTVTTVTVTGDVMLGRRVGDRLARSATRGGAAADGATAGRRRPHHRQPGEHAVASRCAAAGRRLLRRASRACGRACELAGFDVLSLANNHTGDYGAAGAGPRPSTGCGRAASCRSAPAPTWRAAARPAVVERDGVRVRRRRLRRDRRDTGRDRASPGALRLRMHPRTGPLERADLDRVTRHRARLRPQVDVVLVVPHWGTQYTHGTVRDQRVVARALVGPGPTSWSAGTRTGCRGSESVGDALIAYSLGNFVFDMDFIAGRPREGAILELTFWGDRLKAARLVPVVIGRGLRAAGGRTVRAADAILDRVWERAAHRCADARVDAHRSAGATAATPTCTDPPPGQLGGLTTRGTVARPSGSRA